MNKWLFITIFAVLHTACELESSFVDLNENQADWSDETCSDEFLFDLLHTKASKLMGEAFMLDDAERNEFVNQHSPYLLKHGQNSEATFTSLLNMRLDSFVYASSRAFGDTLDGSCVDTFEEPLTGKIIEAWYFCRSAQNHKIDGKNIQFTGPTTRYNYDHFFELNPEVVHFIYPNVNSAESTGYAHLQYKQILFTRHKNSNFVHTIEFLQNGKTEYWGQSSTRPESLSLGWSIYPQSSFSYSYSDNGRGQFQRLGKARYSNIAPRASHEIIVEGAWDPSSKTYVETLREETCEM